MTIRIPPQTATRIAWGWLDRWRLGRAFNIGLSCRGTTATDARRAARRWPFNPSYLVPLVEVAGAEHTDPAAIEWAGALYAPAEARTMLGLRQP
jgi:hypothetical protein